MPGPSTAGLPGGARAHLVTRLRTLLGSSETGFTNDQLRQYLDENARGADGYARLLGWTSSATVSAVYAAPLGGWDDGWTATPAFPGTVTPDLVAGRWTITGADSTWTPPETVRVQGVIYDVYGAAADALTRDATDRVVSFTTSGGETIRTADSSQLVTEYRSRSWAASVVLDRGDLVGDYPYPGESLWGSV